MNPERVAVIVAHPDDETLWAGGTLLSHPEWDCFVAALCRKSDPDRAPKFRRALAQLGASGRMADLDDGPAQLPLPREEVEEAVLSLLPDSSFDVLVTHGPQGEYTRHRRHDETSDAVTALWSSGQIRTGQLWLFAYEDGRGRHTPRACHDAHQRNRLPEAIWQQKYAIISETYGFGPGSFEARTTPRVEAFWCFASRQAFERWSQDREQKQ